MSEPSSDPTFKLYYFNLNALAETIRFIFAYAGQEYEDVRINDDDWDYGAIKTTMPLGQMPVLEVDGIKVNQSFAIARYLAKRFGLAGSNDWESLQVDVAVDTLTDLRLKIHAAHFEEDQGKKEKLKAVVTGELVPLYLGRLEQLAKENDGHLAVSKLTWADFFFTIYSDIFKVWELPADYLDKYPNLQKVVNNVNSLDSIKAWIKKRPEVEY